MESEVYGLSRPPKKPRGKEADEVDTTTNTSRTSVLTSENTTQTITNLSKNGKVLDIGSTIKEHEVITEFLLRDSKHQIKRRPTEMEDESTGLLGNLPHVQMGGEPKTMTRLEDKEKN